MNKLKVFISSVQSEFAHERQMLYEYLLTDALLGRFFEPFIFEKMPAANISASAAYLEQVQQSEVYIGVYGKQYGFENAGGISPTEEEFNRASAGHKIRLIFIRQYHNDERHPKEVALIQKAGSAVVRKKFSDESELKTAVYAALVNVLEERELIRSGPIDASVCKGASLDDVDPGRVRWFVEAAQAKRGFPLSPTTAVYEILTHLNLLKSTGVTNAGILLFGKQPQRFFITAEVRCVMFHGNEVSKPIPSYQVYKGDVFQQVNQAVDFVLSRINVSVGDRSASVDAPVAYEIPPTAIAEAVVNAIAHRDYTSQASVQVMLFRNRLEIWNPGQLPFYLPISKLKQPHASYPPNPLLAEPLYLSGYIERLGTGIPDMIKACVSAGLQEPDLVQDEAFKVILWRPVKDTPYDTPYDTPHDTPHVSVLMRRFILIISGEMTRQELQETLGIKDLSYFRESYLTPAIELGMIEMTIPQKPKSKNQRYRLTTKGKKWIDTISQSNTNNE